jgi:hypothetical protein
MYSVTVLWVALCLAAAWALRRRPDVMAIAILALWIIVPAQASEIVTGVPFLAPTLLNLHPAVYLTYIYSAVFLFVGPELRRTILRLPAPYLLLAWVVVFAGIVTTLQLDQSTPRGFLGNFLAGVLWFFLCAVAQYGNHSFAKWLVITLLALAVANALLSIVQSLVGDTWPYTAFREMYQPAFKPGADRTTGTTDHPLVLALLLAASLPITVLIRRLWVSYVLAILLFVGLLLSGSRAGLVMGTLGFSAAMLFSSRVTPQRILLYALSATTGIVLYFSAAGATVVDRFANDVASAATRSTAYAYVWEHLREFLFLGGGYGSSFSLKDNRIIPSSIENGYAILLVDIGLVAAGVFLLVQLAILWRGWKGAAPRAFIWSSATAMATAATFSSFAVTSACGVLVWAPLALVAATTRASSDAEGGQNPPSLRLNDAPSRGSVPTGSSG